ncbi:MAG: amidohydrolase family protein, partial [Caldilineaceae bacterium]
PVIVDHLAHPDVAAGIDAPEFQQLLQLAKLPNLHIKLSGFYHFTGQPFPYPDCRPLVQALYDTFDPQRLLWGSDFPHVILKTDYGRTVRGLQAIGVNFSQADLTLIMGENASRLYWKGEKWDSRQ